MRIASALLAALLVGCSPGNPSVTFERSTCQVSQTTDERDVRRMGGCIVWATVGKVHTCTAYSHYTVRQHRQVISCAASEWVDGRGGVE